MSKPYFPPPPSASITTHQPKSKKANFSFRHQHESHVESQPSILKSTPRPPQQRLRKFTLLTILIISFTTLILGTIFAYCTALPHSSSRTASNGPSSTRTITMATINLTSANAGATAIAPNRRDYQVEPEAVAAQATPTAASPVSTSSPSTESPATAPRSDEANSAPVSSLVFYTATLPLLTMLHTITLLAFNAIRTPSQNTHLTEYLNVVRGVLNKSSSISLVTSSALLLGWTFLQVFVINCELVGNRQACPVQIQGHRMGGVSGLSIGKVVLGFLVMVGYLVFGFVLVKAGSGERKRMEGKVGFLRRARFQAQGDETVDGEVEQVVRVGKA